jgi:RHS repeat-associated protein
LLTDPLGSTIGLVDGSGTVQTSYTYEPFGKTSVTGAANGNTQQFTGRENDGPLYYYRARYYIPTFGRFVSEDPAGYGGSGTNLYTYVQNDPINVADPSGENPLVAACAGGAIFNVGFNLIGNWLSSRKTTLGDVVGSAVAGCGAGLAGFGLGKFIGWVGGKILGAGEEIAANTAVDVAANRTAGKAAESILSQTFGGSPRTIILNGARRDIDNFINGVAQEAKVGYTSLTTFIKDQIAKDAALLADPASGVTSVEWHFFSSATGSGGTAPLIQALRDAGVKIFYHP